MAVPSMSVSVAPSSGPNARADCVPPQQQQQQQQHDSRPVRARPQSSQPARRQQHIDAASNEHYQLNEQSGSQSNVRRPATAVEGRRRPQSARAAPQNTATTGLTSTHLAPDLAPASEDCELDGQFSTRRSGHSDGRDSSTRSRRKKGTGGASAGAGASTARRKIRRRRRKTRAASASGATDAEHESHDPLQVTGTGRPQLTRPAVQPPAVQPPQLFKQSNRFPARKSVQARAAA